MPCNDRRRILGKACPWLWLPLSLLCCSPPPETTRPNVVVVLVDDLGYGHLEARFETYTESNVNQEILARSRGAYTLDSALEAARSSMPTLHQLVDKGVRFTDAHNAHSLCAPSRAALLTGRYPQSFGVYTNVDVVRAGVPESVPFLGELFQQSGYATAAIGKWHLSRYVEEQAGQSAPGQHPNDRGFDHFFGFNRSGIDFYGSDSLFRDRERVAASGYLTDQLTGAALDFVDRTPDEQPFFLYLAYGAPHHRPKRWTPPEYDGRYADLPKPLRILNSQMYAVDQGIRRLLDLLRKRGQLDDTLFVFLSDNGAPGSLPLPSNGSMRGYKGTQYMGGTRTSLVAHWPNGLPTGRVVHQTVSSFDILPTALEAAGITIPESWQVDGRSWLPLARGEQEAVGHEHLVWAGRNAEAWSLPRAPTRNVPAAWTVKSGPWLLHYFDSDQRYELYDSSTDIAEQIDITAENPDVVRRLQANYAEWFKGMLRPLAWDAETWMGLIPEEDRSERQERRLAMARRRMARLAASPENSEPNRR